MTWVAPAGGITAVLGPNGAGKTTAIECAVGLQRPDGGTVRVLGTDPWLSSAEHRARVGVMLQSGGLPNGTKPLRLLAHLASLYAVPADISPPASRLGIDAFSGTTVRRLSGGQKQRLALAAALIGRPEVLFLDEPTAGLDPHGRLDVYDLLREVAADGPTVVVTTHAFDAPPSAKKRDPWSIVRYLALAARSPALPSATREVAARLVRDNAHLLWDGRESRSMSKTLGMPSSQVTVFSPDPAAPARESQPPGIPIELSTQLQAWTILEAAASLSE